jgi:hypothetical protein
METGNILEYSGNFDFKVIDQLLLRLRKNKGFLSLDKTTSKRVYAIIVECLENIVRHSYNIRVGNKMHPYISVSKQSRIILVRTGNAVLPGGKEKLQKELDLINVPDENDLLKLYDSRINTKSKHSGSGLGLIIIRLKSGNMIEYSFRTADSSLLFFEMSISVKKQYMRKLIVNKTTSSPTVILDPEKEVFQISGESRPPDVSSFYSNILTWFDEYSRILVNSDADKEITSFDLDFEYFNSSSAKYILDLCKKIGEVRSRGKIINVRWHYEEDDADMFEAGREMSRMVRFPFEYVVKTAK